MKKIFQIFVILTIPILFLQGCAIFTEEKQSPQKSPFTVEEIQDKLKVGMDFQPLAEIIGAAPELLESGTAKFSMQNGDLWVRCVTDGQQLKQVLFWGTIIRLPDGTTIKRTSKDSAIKTMLNNPICIDISIDTEFDGKKRTGKCYYEQYGPGNILVEASETGDKSKEVSLILVNGKNLLQKGDIPTGSEFKYLAGYMANLQLLQRLVGKGMNEATPVENGRRAFEYSSEKEPFVINILNKKIVYPAPWSVKGFVEPAKEEKGFSFNINFKVTWGDSPATKIQATEFSGTFKQEKKPFGQDINVSDWKQFKLDDIGDVTRNKVDFSSFEELLKNEQR